MRMAYSRNAGDHTPQSPLERILANPAIDRPTLFKLVILGFTCSLPLLGLATSAQAQAVSLPNNENPFTAANENGPIVAIVQPAYNDQLKGTTQIIVGVETRRYTVQTFELFVDGRTASNGPVGAASLSLPSATFNWDTKLYPDGPHKLLVRVTDTQGFIGQSEVTVYINNNNVVGGTPPSLSWATVPEGPLHGKVNIQLKTIDTFGIKWLIASLKSKDAAPGKMPLKSWLINRPPYTISLDTTKIADGDYILSALAYNSIDDEGEAPPLPITIGNTLADVMGHDLATNGTTFQGSNDNQIAIPTPLARDQNPFVPPAIADSNTVPLDSHQSVGTVLSNESKAPEPLPGISTNPVPSTANTDLEAALAAKIPVIGSRLTAPHVPDPGNNTSPVAVHDNGVQGSPADTLAPSVHQGAMSDAAEQAKTVAVGTAQPAPHSTETLIAETSPRSLPPGGTLTAAPVGDSGLASNSIADTSTPAGPARTFLAAPPNDDPRSVIVGDAAPTTAPVGAREAQAPEMAPASTGLVGSAYVAQLDVPAGHARTAAELASSTLSTSTIDTATSAPLSGETRIASSDIGSVATMPNGQARVISDPSSILAGTTSAPLNLQVSEASSLLPHLSAPGIDAGQRTTLPTAVLAPALPDGTLFGSPETAMTSLTRGSASPVDAINPGLVATLPHDNQRQIQLGSGELSVVGSFTSNQPESRRVAVTIQRNAPYFHVALPAAADRVLPVRHTAKPMVHAAVATPSAHHTLPLLTSVDTIESRGSAASFSSPKFPSPEVRAPHSTEPRFVMGPSYVPPSRAPITAAITVAPTSNWVGVHPMPASYVAQRNDTLTAVAARFNVPVGLLSAANKIAPATQLRPGSTVHMPQPLTVSYHGKVVTGDVGSLMVGSTAVTPFRFLFEQQGGVIEWDAKHQRVTARNGNSEVTLNIGSRTAIVDHKEQMMDLAAFLLSGRTMVPLRFFEKALHAQVQWEPSTGRLFVAMANP